VVKSATTKKQPKPTALPKSKPVSAQDIARDLSAGMKPRTSALAVSSRSGTESVAGADAIFWSTFQQAFYNAWLQPSYADVGKAIVRIRVRLGAGGYVSDPVLTKSSGNEKMDASAMQAAQSVTLIPGLPADFVAAHNLIEIDFKVEDEGAIP
jgi:TonB family protein